MSTNDVVDIAKQALWIIIKASSPMLVVSLIIGLIVSIFQTVTSIQDQTLSFVPKIIAVFLTLMICGSWLLTTLQDYIIDLFHKFSTYVG